VHKKYLAKIWQYSKKCKSQKNKILNQPFREGKKEKKSWDIIFGADVVHLQAKNYTMNIKSENFQRKTHLNFIFFPLILFLPPILQHILL
jgi:hypothetical protein